MALLLLQVVQRRVESYRNGVLCGSVRTICELVRVEVWGEMILDVLKDQSLKALHDYRSKGHQTVIVQAGDGRLIRHWDYCS